MDMAIAAALSTIVGFSVGDIFTTMVARRLSGKASVFLLTVLKLIIYVPCIILWWPEFKTLSADTLVWIVPLGIVFAIAYLGFNVALEVGHAALVGIIAGAYPAVASVIAIVFFGERPSAVTLLLLLVVLVGVALIGLPEQWRKSLKWDKGMMLALVPFVGWGVVTGFLNDTIARVGTEHAWFVVQATFTVVMVICVAPISNKHIPTIVKNASNTKAWVLVMAAGVAIGVSEAVQALALGKGSSTIIIVAILGAYPAAYFLMAHKIFKEPLIRRQWIGIVTVAIAIVLISIGV